MSGTGSIKLGKECRLKGKNRSRMATTARSSPKEPMNPTSQSLTRHYIGTSGVIDDGRRRWKQVECLINKPVEFFGHAG